MRDRRRVPSGPWQALAALSAALLVGCQSDLLSFASFNSSESGSERAVAEELPLGSWTRDRLHCVKDRCERWYEIAVEERGTLQTDLYAPVGGATCRTARCSSRQKTATSWPHTRAVSNGCATRPDRPPTACASCPRDRGTSSTSRSWPSFASEGRQRSRLRVVPGRSRPPRRVPARLPTSRSRQPVRRQSKRSSSKARR